MNDDGQRVLCVGRTWGNASKRFCILDDPAATTFDSAYQIISNNHQKFGSMSESEYKRARNSMEKEIRDAQFALRILQRTMTLLWRRCEAVKGGKTPGDPVPVEGSFSAFDQLKLLVSGELWDTLPEAQQGNCHISSDLQSTHCLDREPNFTNAQEPHYLFQCV